jgi:hypothetical protein
VPLIDKHENVTAAPLVAPIGVRVTPPEGSPEIMFWELAVVKLNEIAVELLPRKLESGPT